MRQSKFYRVGIDFIFLDVGTARYFFDGCILTRRKRSGGNSRRPGFAGVRLMSIFHH